jgi:hypothetical protein
VYSVDVPTGKVMYAYIKFGSASGKNTTLGFTIPINTMLKIKRPKRLNTNLAIDSFRNVNGR